MKTLVIDLDGTIALDKLGADYESCAPNLGLISKLHHYKSLGYEIVIYTARNMNSLKEKVGRINVETLPVILDWLNKNHVPYDEVFVGKPWCGEQGFYVDDRAIRPDEFVSLKYEELMALLNRENNIVRHLGLGDSIR